jgi:hypothetical protein
MQQSRKWGVLFLALALLLPVAGSAQLVSRGSISGTVLDSTGAVVPDAKVTVAGETGSREGMSGPEGNFLFLALEPGLYRIKVEKAGFKIAEAKDINVRLNERASINITLETGAITQTVEVTDVAVGIDPTTTTSGGTISASLFQNAPVGRNITDIPYLVAGVNDSLGVGQANPSISGSTGFENMYIVNGVNITNAGYGAIGTYSNVFGSLGSGVQFDFVKEVQVKTSGFEAQYGQALGGIINMNTKGGGNATHGGAYVYIAPNSFETARKQPNAVRFNTGQEQVGLSSYDAGGDIGGYLVKDRVFWYGGFNAVWNRPVYRGPSNYLSSSLLGDVTVQTRVLNYSGKLNFNLDAAAKHQAEFSIFGDPSKTENGPNRPAVIAGGGSLQTDFPDRRNSELEYGSRNWTVRYNGAWTNSWLFNASFNWAHNDFTESGFPDIFGVEDRTEATVGAVNPVGDGLPTPGTSRGLNQLGGIGFYENNDADNKQWAINATNIFNFWGGHQVDYGFQYEDVDYAWFHERSGAEWTLPCQADPDLSGPGGLVDVIFANGTGVTAGDCGATVFGAQARMRLGGPTGYRLSVIRGAFTGREGNTTTKYGAGYIQDAWSFNKYITAKVGIRYEQQRIAGELLEYTFANNWAPRLGVIVDPWGDRKTKIFYNWGRFFEKVPQDLAVRSLSEERQYIGPFFAVTNPSSLDAAFVSGPGCPVGSTVAFCLSNPANWILDQAHLLTTNFAAGFSGGVTTFAAGTAAQYQHENVAGIERELPGGYILSARYVDRRIQRVLEDVGGLTVGGVNTGVAFDGTTAILQNFVLANPSSNLDVYQNTLCQNPSEDVTVEDANGVGCLVSGYAIGSGNVGADGLSDGFPNVIRKYRAVELGLEKRFSKNWQMSANWRISKLEGNYEGLFRNDNQQTDPNITSLFDFPFSSSLGDQFNPGVLPTDRRHIVNIYSSYLFESGFNMGMGWRIQSGYPLDALGAHPAYLNQGEIPQGGRGSQGRSDATNTFDVHGDYTWKMTERFRTKFVADLFNIFNRRGVARVDRYTDTGFLSGVTPPIQANPDFLLPTAQFNAYQRPFYARFAVRLEF